jgi:branched-chain amino acid transport system permease protein
MLAQQIVNGLVIGSTYALFAAGFSLAYGTLGIVNVAHGEFYTIGAYGGFVGAILVGGGWILAVLGCLVGVLVVALMLELGFLAPLRRASMTSVFVATLGASMFLQNLIAVLFTPEARLFPSLIPAYSLFVGPLQLTSGDLVILSVSGLLMLALKLVIDTTRVGRQVRAVAENADMAECLGVNVRAVARGTVLISAAMAGIAGLLVGSTFTSINPFMGGNVLLKAIAIVVIGGTGSVEGAIVASILLGMAEALTGVFFQSGYSDIVSFLFLAIVLIVRPQGLFGKSIRAA